jgi:signal peptidase I
MYPSRAHIVGRCLGLGLLWTIGGLVLCLLLAGAAPLALGDHSYVIRSGSMTPTIETGDVVVTEPIAPLSARVGQIVTFKDPDGSGRLLSHRLRAVHRRGEKVSFVTQGDANTGQERWSVPIDGEIGRVLYRVPKIGFALVWTKMPIGQIGLIVIPALLLSVLLLGLIWRRPGKKESGAPLT